LASSFYLWSRRHEQARIAALAGRDLANVSWEGEGARSLVRLARARETAVKRPELRPLVTEDCGDAPAAEVKFDTEGVKMPATVEEALEVLGASPDAAILVIKKIVDGLRQSWHPDLAKSDADRLYREQRLRQINVAWDLIRARSSAA
jgi:hypothetical protein